MEDRQILTKVERWLDDLYELLFDLKPKGGEQTMRCPNCDADMEYDEETGNWECPDCGYSDER